MSAIVWYFENNRYGDRDAKNCGNTDVFCGGDSWINPFGKTILEHFKGISFQHTGSTGINTPIVSTRGHVDESDAPFGDDPWITAGHTQIDYDIVGNIPGFNSEECVKEIVIYVHGFNNDENSAAENFNHAQTSLQINNYDYPVIGFSWDSDVGLLDFDDAKIIAEINGIKLAQFIIDFKTKSPDTQIHLIGHSLGSRVILTAIQSLHDNTAWNSKITSVHLLGAAVDNEVIGKNNEGFGNAIENEVGEFHNKYNPEDDVLSDTYFAEEGDQALGENGAQRGISLPSNYNEENVSGEVGDDHSGYNKHSTDSDANDPGNDGVMDNVVNDWKTQTRFVNPGEYYCGVVYDDFSNMNGGYFSPRSSNTAASLHSAGHAVDVRFDDGSQNGVFEVNADAAQMIIDFLNDPFYGSHLVTYVTFNDEFRQAIKGVYLDDGCSVNHVIKDVPGLNDHFLWVVLGEDRACAPIILKDKVAYSDWEPKTNTIIKGELQVHGNVIIPDGKEIIIANGGSLNFDFENNYLLVEPGGRIIIVDGGNLSHKPNP